MAIQELTEQALNIRRENCTPLEKNFIMKSENYPNKKEDIIAKLTEKDCQVIENYILKMNLIAEQECKYLYVQGARDCVETLKKLGVL